jgi:hypothetical protein
LKDRKGRRAIGRKDVMATGEMATGRAAATGHNVRRAKGQSSKSQKEKKVNNHNSLKQNKTKVNLPRKSGIHRSKTII